MANMEMAAGSRVNGKDDEMEGEWSWWAFCSLALIGALSLVHWLRHGLVQRALKKRLDFMNEVIKTMITEYVNYKEDEEKTMEEKCTQATEWLEAEVIQNYKKQTEELQAEVIRLEEYVIELEEQAKDLRQQRNDIFRQFQISDQHGQRLMRERLMYRTVKGNRIKIHFSPNCHILHRQRAHPCAVNA